KFTPDYARWQGGIYERMVGTIKESLCRAVGRHLLEEDDFRFRRLTEVEAVINEQPLTYVSEDIECIRPIDFLLPNAELTFQISELRQEPATTFTREQLLQKWRTSQRTLNRFWKKTWFDTYPNPLRQRIQSEHR
ncbi:hypothetical protein Tcan_01250, partial [Toxocara canis]